MKDLTPRVNKMNEILVLQKYNFFFFWKEKRNPQRVAGEETKVEVFYKFSPQSIL